jgi:putative protease
VFNQYSLQFLRDLGSKSICLSPELNFSQLQNFANFDKVEMLVHGEMILMESQFCSLEALLGKGEGKCSGHCMKDEYYIQDEKSYEFPIATDADCRFYVFNSRTLCMIEDLPRLMAFGPDSLRIEGRRMEQEELSQTVKRYRQAVDGVAAGTRVDLSGYKQDLEQLSKSSFTKCHYYRGVM